MKDEDCFVQGYWAVELQRKERRYRICTEEMSRTLAIDFFVSWRLLESRE